MFVVVVDPGNVTEWLLVSLCKYLAMIDSLNWLCGIVDVSGASYGCCDQKKA
jgi:hypothetical protein